MKTYSKDGITIAVVLDTRRVLANGNYPVKVRVSYARKVTYFSTGKDLAPHDWEVLPTTKNKELARIRKDIENSFELVLAAVEDLAYEGVFSFEGLKSRLRHTSQRTLNALLNERYEELRAQQRYNNADIYLRVLQGVERYEDSTPIERVTPKWLWQYSAFLAGEGKTQTTIAIHLRTIRAVLNIAIREGLMRPSSYPFGRGKFEIQEGEGRKLALTIEQVGMVARYDDGTELTRRYRDYWLFLYLCNGLNMADFVRLRYRDIVGGEIRFVRQKTARTTRKRKEIAVVISEPMRDIIERWGNPPRPDMYIFPILQGKEDGEERMRKTKKATRAINQRMAKVGKVLGIEQPITTYTARHSFATVLKRAGANIAYISESLGHSDLRTTEHYLASFERVEREKNAQLLTQW